MEEVIFLHDDNESQETLSQIQRSLAQRLVLVAPAQMDRLRLSLLLRLARRSINAQAQQSYLISEDHLAQMLAARLGYAVAATLDEYRGLTPGPPSSRKRSRRPPARPAPPAPQPPGEMPSLAASRRDEASIPGPPVQRPALNRERPGANLEKMLEDGYLPNPAATPDLEEEAERAEREEQERRYQERLHYEIADEDHPSQADQEAEQHEARIVARILKTRNLGAPEPAPATPDNSADDRPADREENGPPSAPAAQAATPEDEPAAPEPAEPGSGSSSPAESNPTPPAPPADQARIALHPQEEAASRAEPLVEIWGSRQRPPRTIDALLREYGRSDIFEWFERQATAASTAQSTSRALARAASETPAATAASRGPSASSGGLFRQAGQISRALTPVRPARRWRLRPPGRVLWRRVAIISALAFSLLMTGVGLALIPSAEVRYHAEIMPYSDLLQLDAQPGTSSKPTSAQQSTPALAEIARYDGTLTALATATGQRVLPGVSQQPILYPTQNDVDRLADDLQAQLQRWGENVLRAQEQPGDILGPALAETQVLAFPAAGTSLPVGVSRFQVSLALHLRATLIRHQALLQAIQARLRQDVSQARPGFAPQPGQTPQTSILSVESAGSGNATLELLVRLQANELIGPALTPEQVRSAIAGMAVPAAEAYLSRQPGMSAVLISVQPKWLNRLPIFSARIRIDLES